MTSDIPQNQLPYVDKFKILIIPDEAAAIEAMRQGKIDALDQISIERAQALQKTNPEILQIMTPSPSTPSIDPRNDLPPFNDIRVRKALQLAIDLPAIARTYYGGKAVPNPSTLTSRDVKGWGFPYENWPQDLKDEYSYNPQMARQLLADAGYPNGFRTEHCGGIYRGHEITGNREILFCCGWHRYGNSSHGNISLRQSMF